jgi:hypothetical protein
MTLQMSYKKGKGHQQQVNLEVKKEDKKPKIVALLSGGLDSSPLH